MFIVVRSNNFHCLAQCFIILLDIHYTSFFLSLSLFNKETLPCPVDAVQLSYN
ncbi:hypothetical protein BCV72DRAFT_103017 [Rhizopus microsporus var. microsporus]|uniref:Uncharacterized protein n=1 Tax=Rhizopus microsporus var. microsporus TaxID=86635 RepID=A0A1X0R6V5_RHIZD|nr:hypothetical protein BCV72DRAFT_103017 [Rhizopus microsporus var. microsporus]